MMAVLLTVTLFLASERVSTKLSLALATVLQVVALFLTYTRASLLALAGGILALGWLMEKRKLAAGVLIAGAIAAVAIPSVRSKLFDRHDRLVLWWSASQVIADHPLAGIGEGNHERVVFSSQDYMDTPFGVASSTAHNSVLQSAVHHGVFGGVAHLLLYLLAGLIAVQAVNRAAGRDRVIAAGIGAALFGYLCQDQFNNLMYVPKVATQAWFLFGLLRPRPEE
jgi:O-antigen ligase